MKNVKNAFMAMTAILFIGLVFSACNKEEDPTPPVPGFDYSPTDVIQWDNVTFTNTTTGGESYSWDFGDGSAASTDENPEHQYLEAGTFTVSLTATNEDGDKTTTMDVVVAAPNNNYVIDGTEYAIDTAFTYSSMGMTYWRMYGEIFPGANPAVPNLLKFYPNIGTGTLEGSYTYDHDTKPVGTFYYGFTAGYAGMQMDSTAVDIGTSATLVITKFATDIYEFKLDAAVLQFGYYDWGAGGVFVPSGYEPTYSVLYRGPVTPIIK